MKSKFWKSAGSLLKGLVYFVLLLLAVEPSNSDGTRIVAALMFVGGVITERLQALIDLMQSRSEQSSATHGR